ncbi:ABC transporter substrate-binding protein [Microbacterium sp. No. 7]|uniref:ABC transporter substrate-binding protein n=1 Tax=Microbacterium sp. No. 7 TaxID=1714373 RepID=UPI0006D25939|nr:ABC transporter substrate-binding protein [Microbacterium sp. No. 7]ALJ19268.1 hypothetical protein AOA12_04860 [Microbacterium sp. No. 7]
MKKNNWIKVAAASGAVLVLALAGCAGGSDDNAGSTGGSGDGGSSSEGNKTIIAGVSAPKTGPVASAGEGQACGFEAFFDAANKAGGIGGYDVKVETRDNQYEGQASATIAQELVAEGAVAIFAGGTVPIDGARGATTASNVVLLGAGDGAAFAPPQAPGDYSVYPRYQDDMASAIDYAATDLDAKKVSVVLALGAGDASMAAADGAAAKAGVELGTTVELNLKEPQWAAWAKQLKDAGAEAVYVQHVDTTLAQLQKESANIGYTPKWILAPFGYGPGYLELAGDLAEGTVIAQWAWPSVATEEASVTEFIAAVEGYSDACAAILDNPNVGVGYNHAAILAHGIELAAADGDVTGETIAAALQEVSGEPFGTVPSVTFTAESHAGGDQVSYWTVTDGVLVNSGDWRDVVVAD